MFRYPLLFREHTLWFQCTLRVSQQQFHNPVRPFPLAAPSGQFAAFTGTIDALRLPTFHPTKASFPSPCGTTEHPLLRISLISRDGEPSRPRTIEGLSQGRPLPVSLSREVLVLPASRGILYMYALLPDPGRIAAPHHNGALMLSPQFRQRRLRQYLSFRGSITRLSCLLSTLRASVTLYAQDSLPVVG
jgi:hypothetical protein